MPTTQYLMDTKLSGVWAAYPCMLQGITLHEGNLGGGDYSICDNNVDSLENVVMVIRSVPFRSVTIAFPQPIYFSKGIYIETAGGIPTITLELL